jgi:hypothetical protein
VRALARSLERQSFILKNCQVQVAPKNALSPHDNCAGVNDMNEIIGLLSLTFTFGLAILVVCLAFGREK